MTVLAMDIGGANLKVADGCSFGRSVSFPLWRTPERLSAALSALLAETPETSRLVATMTGELADCYATKVEGVRAIVRALVEAAGGRALRVYLTTGEFVEPERAVEQPLLAAASNWHALARFAARWCAECGLLVDIGSTTTDVIPILAGEPSPRGRTDPERLLHGELVYTGVVRSPVCSVVRTLPWRDGRCRVAQELFATTLDAYLLLGDIAEDEHDTNTADGRGATRSAAHDRLARTICADRTMFSWLDAQASAREIARSQEADLAAALWQVVERMPQQPLRIVVSGQGEFLARRVAASVLPHVEIVSLGEQLGPALSCVAPAHALATLAREVLP